MKAPQGFPMDLTKWSIVVTNTGVNTQSSPSAGTWYNTGNISITVPIGVWELDFKANGGVLKNNAILIGYEIALSTSNNSESDDDLSAFRVWQGASNGTNDFEQHTMVSKVVSLASKTTYYLIHSTGDSSVGSIRITGNTSNTRIWAKCAYL